MTIDHKIAWAKVVAYRATHPRVRTTDAKRVSHCDGVLTADPQPKNPGLFGNSTAETGTLLDSVTALRAAIDALPKAQQRDAWKRIRDQLEEGFGSQDGEVLESESLKPGAFGSTATVGHVQRMNDAKYKPRLWGDDAPGVPGVFDRVMDLAAQGTPRSINEANKLAWGEQRPSSPYSKPWGKG